MWNWKNGKRFIITAAMVCAVGLGLTGCMGAEKSENSMQEMGEDIPGNDNMAGEDAGNEPENADAPAPESNSKEQELPESNSGTGEDAGNKAENADTPVSGQTELSGDICEIGDMQFTVNEITITEDEMGGETAAVMVIGAPGDGSANLITVVYDENTVFTKRTIWDMGARYEDKEAASADLEENLTAEMKGSYEGEKFHASEVRIVEVVLDE